MNGESSPSSMHTALFDLPYTRTVKPLPRLKRQETQLSLDLAVLPSPQAIPRLDQPSYIVSDRQAPLSPKDIPNPAPTTALHQNQFPLSPHPPLPSYYYPFFPAETGPLDHSTYGLTTTTPQISGAGRFSPNGPGYGASGLGVGNRLHSPPSPYPPAANFSFNLSPSSVHYGIFGLNISSSSEDEEDLLREADYGETRDRDQQGNTKKRKVPATHQRARNFGEVGGNVEPSLNGSNEEVKLSGVEKENLSAANSDSSTLRNKMPGFEGEKRSDAGSKKKYGSTVNFHIQSRMSPAALACYRNKELLRIRKRQLSTVLGPSALAESFALDQALLTRLPWHVALGKNPEDSQSPSRETSLVRKRRKPLRAVGNYEREHDTQTQLPKQNFTFNIPSPTSERMVATLKEAGIIRSRFEVELTRQAQKLAESARKAASSGPPGGGRSRNSKHSDPSSQRKSSATMPSGNGVTSGAPTHPPLDTTGSNDSSTTAKPRGSKKKKRSALANASNPHHLRNYVPSRVPNSIGGTSALTPSQLATNAQNAIGPLPLRFLSADLPPRRNRGTDGRHSPPPTPHSNIQVTAPVDEWICSFCEYALFFGSDAEYRKAIRNRKKVLSRRRRARERAAAAASGQGRVTRAFNNAANDTDEENMEDQPARFVDPKVVDERVEATMRGLSVVREKG